jgi:hypothetical protein
VNVCIRFDKLSISSFIGSGSMTYDKDIKIETSINHDVSSDDGSGIYNPISSAIFITFDQVIPYMNGITIHRIHFLLPFRL